MKKLAFLILAIMFISLLAFNIVTLVNPSDVNAAEIGDDICGLIGGGNTSSTHGPCTGWGCYCWPAIR
jgi:hypothetical protein